MAMLWVITDDTQGVALCRGIDVCMSDKRQGRAVLSVMITSLGG